MGKADRSANEPYGECIAKLSFFCGELDEEDRNGMKFLYSTLVLNHSDTIK